LTYFICRVKEQMGCNIPKEDKDGHKECKNARKLHDRNVPTYL
jgi:hypothetical protein